MGNVQSATDARSLTKADLDRMQRRMVKLGRGRPELARSDLQGVEGMKYNPFLDRLFELFDSDGDRLLSTEDMKRLLETLTQLNDDEARYQFAFLVFDIKGDGFIDLEELLAQLERTNTRKLTKPQLQAIAESTIARYDADKDGMLSYVEFKALLGASTAADMSL